MNGAASFFLQSKSHVETEYALCLEQDSRELCLSKTDSLPLHPATQE